MGFVAMIGLIFGPLVSLLFAGAAQQEDLLPRPDRRRCVPGGVRRAEAAIPHCTVKIQ